MKTTLTALIATLFLLTTPLLVTAHDGGQHKSGSERHDRGWERDRHQDRQPYRDHRQIHNRGYRAEKQYNKHHRKQYAHYPRQQRHHHPVYAAGPAVIFGAPRIVFRIDW